MTESPALDADGFPLFPTLPGGRPVPTPARSLARMVAGIRGTVVLAARTEAVGAMVVFLHREPIDGIAVRGDRRVTGPDVLDEIADVPVDAITMTEVAPELAAVLGSYFLPTEVRGVPAGVVVAEDFLRSLARPGQRGCVLVRAGDRVGLVFLAGGRVLLAYRLDGDAVGGFEQVAPLFEEPSARLWARLGPDDAARSPAKAEPAGAAPPAPVPQPGAAPAYVQPAVEPMEPIQAPPIQPAAAPAAAPAGAPPAAPAGGPALVTAVLDEIRQVLGPHTVRVEGLFLRAEPTAAGLRAAAESLRERRVRLLSQATLDLAAGRALALLDRTNA